MASMTNLYAEVFTEYGLSICCLLLRFFARWRTIGVKNFDIGDAFAAAACVFYSLETAGIYLLSNFGNNVGLNAKTAMLVPDSEVPQLELGSKIVFMNWLWYITFIWSLKGILLTLYWKMGRDVSRQEIMVKLVSAFVFCTWLGCILTHILICPPPKCWQIKPYPGDICTARGPDYIVIAVLNVVSDIGIMAIPLPLLWKVSIPLRRKLLLGSIFGLGAFVCIATILRAYYSLLSLDALPIALGWASRETFVATVAATAPGIKPLFSKSKWLRSTSQGESQSRNKYYYDGYTENSSKGYADFSTAAVVGNSEHGENNTSVSAARSGAANTTLRGVGVGQSLEMDRWRRGKFSTRKRMSTSDESDEKVIMEDDSSDKKDYDQDILITTEYAVRRDDGV